MVFKTNTIQCGWSYGNDDDQYDNESLGSTKTAVNSFHVMAVNKRPTFGVLFLGSISPSKMGRIAPFLATIQPFSKARVFLLTGFRLWRQYSRHFWGYIFSGAYFPQKWDVLPPFSHDSTSFKNMWLLI
jgi:hypothetical protein